MESAGAAVVLVVDEIGVGGGSGVSVGRPRRDELDEGPPAGCGGGGHGGFGGGFLDD